MHSVTFEDLYVQDVASGLGRLRVRSIGQGEPIIFWSSLLMSARMWMAQVRYFSQRYRVILVDPPGHGDSAKLDRTFTFAECAQCLVDVLDELGVEKAHFIGNSWGGMIGGTFAAMHPDRLGAAVLMNCTASPAGWRHRIEFPLLARVIRLLGGFRGSMTSVATRAFVGPTTERERPDVITHIHQSLKACDVESVAWAVESVVPSRPDQREVFAAIRSPVLVMAGKEDRTFSVGETLAMARAIPGAEYVTIERTAHLAALENPDEVNTLIDRFLQRVRKGELAGHITP